MYYIDEHLALVDNLSKDWEAVTMWDVQHILHACFGSTCYQHHTPHQESEVMVFALELARTYWSINVTEPRFEQPALDLAQIMVIAMATVHQN